MHPYLSIVVASRNDDHGGDPLIRTQIFINCFMRQCEKFKLPAEIILVDWNPVPNRPGLASVLQPPKESNYCTARVITVPSGMHQTLKYAENLPLFQMIAKNVGIRRAKGEFVLATNIDIIFSNELMEFLAQRKLDPKRLYRTDRYDIQVDLPPDIDLETALEKAWESVIRANVRYNLPELTDHLYGTESCCRDCGSAAQAWELIKGAEINLQNGRTWEQMKGISVVRADGVWQIQAQPDCPFEHLNTNACGDFTLLSKEAWETIRGYPDFEAYSFNIDSMGIIMAHYHGFQEVSLLPPCVCFHIEHALGSGWSPEGEQKLFGRLNEKKILNPEWHLFLGWFSQMREEQKAIIFNRDDWGLSNYFLAEHSLGSNVALNSHQYKVNAISGSVGSLYPAYDLDRIALFYERETRQESNNRALQAVPVPVVSATNPADFNLYSDIFNHHRDSNSILGHYTNNQSPKERPLVVWAPTSHFEYIQLLLVGRIGRELIAGDVLLKKSAAATSFESYDVFLLATNPQQMLRDIYRSKLLNPRLGYPELVIWVLSNDSQPLQYIRWLPSIKLARRLLTEVGWLVVVESQSELR